MYHIIKYTQKKDFKGGNINPTIKRKLIKPLSINLKIIILYLFFSCINNICNSYCKIFIISPPRCSMICNI
jgi:hypothetical protein